MRHFISVAIYLLLCQQIGYSQPSGRIISLTNAAPGPGVTRAVVIGISDYPSPGIRPLQYAHKDALAFADFLRSKAGGSLADDQVRILINDDATLAAIDDAFYWLKTVSEKGDQAIVYFAGHGDVETEAHWQFGYLLSRDSPANNFRNNAVRVEDLDLLAIELSSVKEVKTIFIIDACRSGTLSEGRQVPHEHLGKQRANEVRILSCKADQVSLEGGQWGGGRGVFSYHLIQGLHGMAKEDGQGDDPDLVTLEELQEYLRKSLRKETQQLLPATRQDPVIAGPETFVIATIDQDALARVKSEAMEEAETQTSVASRGSSDGIDELSIEPASLSRQWVDWMRSTEILGNMEVSNLLKYTPREVPMVFLGKIRQQALNDWSLKLEHRAFLAQFQDKELVDVNDTLAIDRFNRQLAMLLHDFSQDLINKYLRADREDMAERTYHRLQETSYQRHPALFKLALHLLPADHPLVPRLLIKSKYFEGVVKRIQAVREIDPQKAFKAALVLQLEALALDDKAPYIHNELGILYKRLASDSLAIVHFQKAIQLAPSWGLPYNNLCSIWLKQNNLEEAWKMAEKAVELLPDYYGVHIHLGILHEKGDNLFLAEDHYRAAGRLDPDHYAPNYLLGLLFIRTTEFELAEDQLIQSRTKRLGEELMTLNIDMAMDGIPDILGDFPMTFTLTEEEYRERIRLNPEDVEAHYGLGILMLYMDRNMEAEASLRTVSKLDNNYPKIWDELGYLFFRQKRYAEADIAITRARIYDDNQERRMLHATIFESWDRMDEALAIYESMISFDAKLAIAYVRKGALDEKYGRSMEAERTYFQLWKFEEGLANNALLKLYKKELTKKPTDQFWTLRLAKLMLPYCKRASMDQDVDIVRWIPPHEFLPVKSEDYYKDCLRKPAYAVANDFISWPSVCDEPYVHITSLLNTETDEDQRIDLLRMRSEIHLKREHWTEAFTDMEEALGLDPDAQSLRDQLIEKYLLQDYLAAAKKHQEYQYYREKLRYPQHLLLARSFVHSWDFTQGRSLLRIMETIDLEGKTTTEIKDLRARIEWLSGDFQKAMDAYAALSGTEYMRARLYALQKQNDMALDQLAQALNNGFDLREVLMHDPVWDRLRPTAPWRDLTAAFHLDNPN